MSETSVSHCQAYRDLRARVASLISPLEASEFDQTSPATPAWRVHDVLSHLVGVSDDVVHGRLDGVATDAWTDAQVTPRRDRSATELLAEWDEHAAQFETLLDNAPPEISGQALFDAATHEHDIRCALRAPGARDSDAMVIGWTWLLDTHTRGGGPALLFATEKGEELSGTGEPQARIEASRFELLRAITGRRSASEIASYGWDQEPKPELLLAAPIFHLREQPLAE
jgi:uncharacterized protein (TIGR03083 family)